MTPSPKPLVDSASPVDSVVHEVLGYLNFSSGAADSRFLANLNTLFRHSSGEGPSEKPLSTRVYCILQNELRRLQGLSAEVVPAAFRQLDQAKSVVELTFETVLPAYRAHHRDLLAHQSDESLFLPYFVGRALRAVLEVGGPWDEKDRVAKATVRRLNDFIGHRPVPVLRTEQKIEPYVNEWVAPIPLYARGAGVSIGVFEELVEGALAILKKTEPSILERAFFDLECLDELCLDPRSYDFDHPVNKRPNYQFGQWDPHVIDNRGRYRRFVLQQVALDALRERVASSGDISLEDARYEASAVLAGIILMASGISGNGPTAHDSSATLSNLLPRIASYRDDFYANLLAKCKGERGKRLQAESTRLKQPFGGVRQHLNQRLARLRATQLQHVHLAQLYARMGFPEASHRQAHIVPVTSARMLCEINSRITFGHRAIDRGKLNEALTLLGQIEDLLKRAIECGSIVDPWNILGFQGQFSLFPAIENTARDHRVDVLIHLVRQIHGLYARLHGEAAAADEGGIVAKVSRDLPAFAAWWDRFATTQVSGVESFSGREAAESSSRVAAALGNWRQAGAAAGDMAYWRKHAPEFNSPKAHALVIEALLEKGDYVAAMGLLMQWRGRAEEIPLVGGGFSFHDLAIRWMSELHRTDEEFESEPTPRGVPLEPLERFRLTCKFFDFLEANADEWWEAPRFQWEKTTRSRDEGENDSSEDLFGAAYENFTFQDTASDGVEGDMLEGGAPTDFELEFEATRIGPRLNFLAMLARLWRIAASSTHAIGGDADRHAALAHWRDRAAEVSKKLRDLMKAVHGHPIPSPNGSHESLVEYDRRRVARESLVGHTIAAAVEVEDAARFLDAAGAENGVASAHGEWKSLFVRTWRAMRQGDTASVREAYPQLRSSLAAQPILYIPLNKNGDPEKIVAARCVHQALLALLRGLPRLGLMRETCQLVALTQTMEKTRPVGDGAVTEFDRVFDAGYRAQVECLVALSEQRWGGLDGEAASSRTGGADRSDDSGPAESELVDGLQFLTEALLKRWVGHSRSLRLSALERVSEADKWKGLVEFIERYGHDLFSQRFMTPGNLRGILHEGVDAYLRQLEERPDDEEPALLAELDTTMSRTLAIERLTLILEAVLENYSEYKDFNATTTQSDKGEMLYVLLDFLRLKSSYDRFAWTIHPVVVAHEILVRRGRLGAAELWRRAVGDRTREVADWHSARLGELVKKYGVRLPTVCDRLAERFTRPLAVDRMRALIRPAIEEARRDGESSSFVELEREVQEFCEQPVGAGLDVPNWLLALEHEVDLALAPRGFENELPEVASLPFRLPDDWDDVRSQLDGWETGA